MYRSNSSLKWAGENGKNGTVVWGDMSKMVWKMAHKMKKMCEMDCSYNGENGNVYIYESVRRCRRMFFFFGDTVKSEGNFTE